MNTPASNIPNALGGIQEGKYTSTVYSLIRDGRYSEVIKIMKSEVSNSPKSRAALSLLGYSYYQAQDFASASDIYENLSRFYPEVMDYRLYYAQALYKSAQYVPSQKVCHSIETPEYSSRVLKLQAAIKFENNDLAGCKMLIDQLNQSEHDTIVNQACFLFKEGKYEEAGVKYMDALKTNGYQADLSYYVALCYYMMQQYVLALKFIADIIERGIKDHPELNVGMATEGFDLSSVGNSQILHETFLVEAFNLKAAIEYKLKNYEAAKDALTDMPPRKEEELDPVTLHNQAIMNIENNVSDGFEKMSFLLSQTSFPPETFGNLLLLHIKHEYYDIAADLLAENGPMYSSTLSTFVSEFVDATLSKQSSPEEAFLKFDDMANRNIDHLRKLTKKVQNARQNQDDDIVKNAVEEYDACIDRYIPVLMAQAKIYWDVSNYAAIEKLFRKSVEFCNENETWKLNVAHILFMQEVKYKEAISFYEPIVKRQYGEILDITAIVLANLCVSYIMTSQNEQAEELMKRIEKEEEKIIFNDPTKRVYHLCIVNLVIGTLYCSKGNYEFGITRIVKSLEPFNKKLSADTWYYAKRCFVSFFETLSKNMIIVKDSVIQECLDFFDNAEMNGRDIPVFVDASSNTNDMANNDKNSVAYEARLLKSLFLKLNE